MLPVGLVEICTQASCVYDMHQIHHRPSPGRPVSPYQALDHRVTAVLCHTHAMQKLGLVVNFDSMPVTAIFLVSAVQCRPDS